MGRSTEGFRITKDSRNGIYKVRFRHGGKRFHLSTGTRNKKDAGIVAARIYAEALSSHRRPSPTARIVGRPFDAVVADWLDAIAPPVVSEDTWKYDLEFFRKKLIPHFRHTELITEVGVEDYITTRLRSVRRSSVKKELGSLRRFVTWAVKRGELASFQFPKLPKQAKGTRQLNRPLIELSREQAEAVIRALPVRTRNGHRPRALFTVFWETGLRLRGVQRLTSPRNYEKGAAVLWITEDVDKNGHHRDLPLTPRARAALDSVVKPKGLLFGAYSYKRTLQAAALEAGLSEYEAQYINARSFRHAAVTDMSAHSTELAGVSYLAGHRDAQTTSRYVHPPFEAGKRVNDARFRDTIWDTRDFYEEDEIANLSKSSADTAGFEPATSASGGQRSIQLSYASYRG